MSVTQGSRGWGRHNFIMNVEKGGAGAHLCFLDIASADVCGGDVADVRACGGGERADTVHAVVRVRAEDVRAARAEWEGLADELEGGARVRGEYDGVTGWGAEEVEDGLACLAG